MPTGSARLRAAPPTLRERRGERTLLVWGELGQWMVVDDEVVALLGRFDGERRLDEVARGLHGVEPVAASHAVLTDGLRRLKHSPDPPGSSALTGEGTEGTGPVS